MQTYIVPCIFKNKTRFFKIIAIFVQTKYQRVNVVKNNSFYSCIAVAVNVHRPHNLCATEEKQGYMHKKRDRIIYIP